MKSAIVGGGVIGGGWAARFALNGWSVAVHDPDPMAQDRVLEMLANARRSFPSLYDTPVPGEGDVTFTGSLAEAVAGADWIQESVPERLNAKQQALADITEIAKPDAVIGSSTSGFRPTQLAEHLNRPEQVLVCHPFNPVYLLPLVEVVPYERTDPEIVNRCATILRGLGMRPLILKSEIDGHIADRLLEALWREALWLIHDKVCTTADVDEAIRSGFGLRFAQMGIFETYRIAGGDGGIAHFLQQFGPALQWPWTKLTDVPDLDRDLIETIVAQSDAQSGDLNIGELERRRDNNLVAILRALKSNNWGAGGEVAAHERRLAAEISAHDGPIKTAERRVPQTWLDYNGHMNESHYLEAFSMATDRFLELVGADQEYVAQGGSYFTVETHLRHLAEIGEGEGFQIQTQILAAAGSRVHLFHRMLGPNESLVASAEHMLIHVNLATRKAVPPAAQVAQRISDIVKVHANLPRPEGAGRGIGEK